MEKIEDVKMVVVEYTCDECGLGQMEASGTVRPCDPPQIQHQCNECGHTEWMRAKYPRIAYVKNDGEEVGYTRFMKS